MNFQIFTNILNLPYIYPYLPILTYIYPILPAATTRCYFPLLLLLPVAIARCYCPLLLVAATGHCLLLLSLSLAVTGQCPLLVAMLLTTATTGEHSR